MPRDGRLINLSEGGACVLLRQPPPAREPLTITFPLQGSELVTLTGRVRWGQAAPSAARWHPVGVEWFPLEATTRQRLKTLIGGHATSPARAPAEAIRAPSDEEAAVRRRLARFAVILFGVLGMLLVAAWLVSVERDYHRLADALEQRNAIIRQLEARERSARVVERPPLPAAPVVPPSQDAVKPATGAESPEESLALSRWSAVYPELPLVMYEAVAARQRPQRRPPQP